MAHTTLVDENIPFGSEAFGTLGEVKTMSGRTITSEALADVDVLCVRSVTEVNEELLDGTPVRFVGTATIGVDHVDLDYLRAHEIGFASAPGSNANSVAEYVMAALLVLGERLGFQLSRRTLGIIGVGNVGSRVEVKARALGMSTILNDPPLARRTGDDRYRPIEEVLEKADIITLHVPLTEEGPDATRHMIDEKFLGRLQRGTILLNTSRGGVVDTGALIAALRNHLEACVLDVWEGEPAISEDLLQLVELGTPHIAGYSFDGKVRGTQMIYEAACRFLGEEPEFDPTPLLPPPEVAMLEYLRHTTDRAVEDIVRSAVLSVYDIRRDDANLRDMLTKSPKQRPAYFDALRKHYPRRREFHNTQVMLPAGAPIAPIFSGLGFDVELVR